MNQKSIDLFVEFIKLFNEKHYQKAFQLILPHPDIAYDTLFSEEIIFQYIINFVDASVFYDAHHSIKTNTVLQKLLIDKGSLSDLLKPFVELLFWQSNFLRFFLSEESEELSDKLGYSKKSKKCLVNLKNEEKFSQSIIEEFLEFIPEEHHTFVKRKVDIWRIWLQLKLAKPKWAVLIEKNQNILFQQPLHEFAYHLQVENPTWKDKNKTPLIFLEPIEGANYLEILQPFLDQTILFVFETTASLLQMLQFPEMEKIFASPSHLIYIMEMYPHEQFEAQNFKQFEFKAFEPILLVERKVIQETLPLFIDVLSKCINQESFESDTPIGNWLYRLSDRIYNRILVDRYGFSRNISVHMELEYNAWSETHKGLPPSRADLGPPPHDFVKERIDKLIAERKPRKFDPKNKIRLAHIVPQIVGMGHAPTQLLNNLLTYANKYWFDLFLISTERLALHILDYPIQSYSSTASSIRGNEVLEHLNKLGVHIHVEPDPKAYELTINNISKLLNELRVDVAVFHGPDDINNICACMCDVPIRILFEHGTPPIYPSYDLALLSTEEANNELNTEYRSMGMESCFLQFSVDVRKTWGKELHSKENFGFPIDSFIMTTISNHLDSRISNEMCHAIGEILQRNPKAYYAPMGPEKNFDRLRSIWADYGVNDRVIFMGQKPNPSQYARSMELYLNEFPFGSGLGILDAMAAGCPVVSMYDPDGPMQARYAANYFGIDYVIKSGKKEDYIELACRLIQDKDLYLKWSEHAKNQYEKHSDVVAYVRKFEQIIEGFIKYSQNKLNEGG
ncbi:MAG: glycosyltransferase [Parachlamydiaceae bacterium]|nr:glycosyltransferase [Parachlamydiaceae bacterium]